jgi:hypothetical protein
MDRLAVSAGLARRPAPSAPAPTPRDLQEALQRGWRIKEQLSTWEFTTSNRREGFLFLTKEGTRQTLKIAFTAFYDLSRPYFFGAERQ